MRTLVHLSDIHFGRTDSQVVAELIAAVSRIKPDVVAISGDLTQRARPKEFEQARAFLDALPKPQIVVPGNHDVPLHNVYARFRHAFDAYRQYISSDLEPFYFNGDLAVLGINTARRLTVKGGRINPTQLARIEHRFCTLSPNVAKVVVTHHPFDLPRQYGRGDLVGRAEKAMTQIAECRVDVLLAGHFHVSYCGPTALRYEAAGHSAVFVQAGTACSTRSRGEANSFNVVEVSRSEIRIHTHSAVEGRGFEPVDVQRFSRSPAGWSPTAQGDEGLKSR